MSVKHISQPLRHHHQQHKDQLLRRDWDLGKHIFYWYLRCWVRLSLAFFRGRQTGQSCRVQFFQWEMICLDDAQWATAGKRAKTPTRFEWCSRIRNMVCLIYMLNKYHNDEPFYIIFPAFHIDAVISYFKMQQVKSLFSHPTWCILLLKHIFLQTNKKKTFHTHIVSFVLKSLFIVVRMWLLHIAKVHSLLQSFGSFMKPKA